jgi:serine/threonine protein kinase
MGYSHGYLVSRHYGRCIAPSLLCVQALITIRCPQLITLIWGENWCIFKPDVPADHEEYELKILMKQHQFFGPFPLSYKEIADAETLGILTHIMHRVPPEKMKHFGRAGEREISKEDKAFVLKIMKLDPRDRPTAKELLEDEWFASA